MPRIKKAKASPFQITCQIKLEFDYRSAMRCICRALAIATDLSTDEAEELDDEVFEVTLAEINWLDHLQWILSTIEGLNHYDRWIFPNEMMTSALNIIWPASLALEQARRAADYCTDYTDELELNSDQEERLRVWAKEQLLPGTLSDFHKYVLAERRNRKNKTSEREKEQQEKLNAAIAVVQLAGGTIIGLSLPKKGKPKTR